MTYENFELFIKKNNCYKYPEYYSNNERYTKFIENINRNGCFKKQDILMRYFLKYRPCLTFKKTEKCSGDIVEYLIGLDDNETFFSDEFGEAMIKIGCCSNSSCSYNFSNAYIDIFFLSENEKFYAKKFDDKKIKLIADNEEDFLDYITTVEYDYHAPIDEYTYEVLKNAGWYEGRKADVSSLVEYCRNNDIFLSEKQIDFLQEFGGLNFKNKSGTMEIEISLEKKEIPYAFSYYEKIEPNDETFEGNYMRYYNTDIICIGSTDDDDYGVDPLWLTSDGKFIWDVNGRVLGRTALEGFNILICG